MKLSLTITFEADEVRCGGCPLLSWHQVRAGIAFCRYLFARAEAANDMEAIVDLRVVDGDALRHPDCPAKED